ncbi:MAG: hypothetical protein OJI67_06820, partial [Prosthecobacter sp.]|nr:hypothetical protein [Prosthecobacter sp.]
LFCCATLASAWFNRHDARNRSVKIILTLAVIGYLITFLIPRVLWYYHILPAVAIACLYWIVMFAELVDVSPVSSRRTANNLRLVALAIPVFFIPVSMSSYLTLSAMQKFHSDNPVSRLVRFLNQHEKNNSYDFFSMSHQLSTLEFYTHADYVGSIAFFAWEYARLQPKRYSEAYRQDNRSLALGIISRDLNEKKPRFVFVDIPSSQAYLGQLINFPIDYSSDPAFRDAWSHYYYIASIKPYDIYQRY